MKEGVLTVLSTHACVVIAAKASTSKYKSVVSSAVTFYFGFRAQMTLSLTITQKIAKHLAKVAISARGGSGTGAIRYFVTGIKCAISGHSVTASKPALCMVTAKRASSGSYLPVSSKAVKVKFT